MRGLMHGDRVRVECAPRRERSLHRLGGKTLGRGVSAFLGTVEIQGRGAWVNAADRRLQLRCAVAPADLTGARNGDWVIAASPGTQAARGGAQARIEKRLDPDRPVELATESAIARFELPHEFAATALREAPRLASEVDPSPARGAYRSA